MTLNYFEHTKMEFQKILNLLDATSADIDLPRFVPKKWNSVYDQSEKITMLRKILELKHQR